MFSYYGSKSKVIDHYPPPKHNLIIEPFAGSARYALKHFENDVILNDKYEVVVRIWKHLQKCSPGDILSLPHLKAGTKINRDDFDCLEMAWLMGFMITSGVSTPMLTVSPWGEKNFKNFRKNIAANLFKIKHWEILSLDYTELENKVSTWFIDPPYQMAGNKYKHSNKHIDFMLLSDWCKSRNGQTIVCESSGATWMDFNPIAKQNGSAKRSTEVIWTSDNSIYDNVQLDFFNEPKENTIIPNTEQ